MNRFDLLNDPLAPGVAVVEASAGTGKTFTLAGLVLRMLLEPSGDAAPPGIDQILVVTYTNAATDELRDRIRSRLRSALDAFESGGASDPLERALLQRFTGEGARAECIQRLQDALTLFDQAAIFTIHGFCQRVLKDRAFETDGLFDAELAADTSELVRHAALDFIRIKISEAHPDLIACGLVQLVAPAFLLKAARAVESQAEFETEPVADEGRAAEVVRRRRELLEFWGTGRGAILGLFGGGRKNAWFNTPYNKDDYASKVISVLDRLAAGEAWTSDLVAGLEELAWSEVGLCLGKGKTAPDSRFFELMEGFLNERRALGRSLQAAFADQLKDDLAARQRRSKTQSFDDLLRRTDAALTATSGSQLVETLRRGYRAALIDEFQDTDLLQWRIFRTLFAESTGGHRLRLIGDPKQAIYGFRGADVATYLAARESVPVENRRTLGTNWRSETGLVSAVNQIFVSHPDPFANGRIAFDPVAASGRADTEALADPSGGAPFELWLLGEEDGDVGLAKERAAVQGEESVLCEVERLLGNPSVLLGGKRVQPRDIAILVPQNYQAIAFQAVLRRRGIPSVLQSAESVFASEEAATLERFIAALEAPHSDGRLRLLLASPATGFGVEEFLRMDSDSAFAAKISEDFSRHVKRWQADGFSAAFRSWLDGEGVRGRLTAWPDGERRLTNLLHLGELLQKAEQDGRTGTGLLRWLTDQKEDGARAAEEAEMRLESDDSAVRLVTVHKSKGLEYPIVFCAFLWRSVEPSTRRQADPLVVRRPGQPPLIDLNGYKASLHRAEADEGTLQEHLRLLYVALTRAKNRCYLLTGPVKGVEASALAWLLHGRESAGGARDWEALKARVVLMSRSVMSQELTVLAAGSGGTIRVTNELPQLPAEMSRWNAQAEQVGTVRVFTRNGFDAWGIQSYSGLIAGAAEETPDHDAVELASPSAEDGAPDEFSKLPRGTSLGTCMHEILENVDFTAAPDAWAATVSEKLAKHRLDPAVWGTTVQKLVERLTTARLPSASGEFSLAETSPDRRINELEFFLPTKRFSVPALQRAFSRHESSMPVKDWPSRVADLGFVESGGFLHGYVDAVIEHGGRFYLFDWKTNWLGPNAGAYDEATVGKAMRGGFYVLQYHLYAVALRRFLRLRLGRPDVGGLWGGVFYAFLRGIDPAMPGQGWFFDRPGDELLDGLELALEQGGQS